MIRAISLFISAIALVASVLFTGSSATATTCSNGRIFATDGSGLLYIYDSSGTQIGSTVQLATGYFDIAFDSTNGTFYGIRSGGQIDVVNIATGAVIRSVTARSGFYNAGSVLPGGMIAASVGSTIVYISPKDGTTTDYFNMALIQDENGATYPSANWSSAGDFITLSDGSLLALLSGTVAGAANTTKVVQISNGVGKILGTVPGSWGGARVGTDLVLGGADGKLYKINSLPTTAGRGVIATTQIATLPSGGYYGAAGTEDSEAAACSTTGTNGYSTGVDAYSASVPSTPGVAGTAPAPVVNIAPAVASEAAPTLAETGQSTDSIFGLAGFLVLFGGTLLATRLWSIRLKK